MPTIPQQQTVVQYVANNAQLVYTFDFYVPEDTDLAVYYQASDATPVPSTDILTLNVDYTVTFNADPITGGYITLLQAPTSGYYLTLNRELEASLTTTFSDARTINGTSLDNAFDRLLLLIQQNQTYNLERNLSYVINTYLPSAQPYTQLPPLAQNEVWIGSGAGVVAAEIADNPSASVLQAQLANNALGTDGSRLVGYYDAVTPASTTVHTFLANILTFITDNIGTSFFQPGMMMDFGGSVIPDGWLPCNGAPVSRTTYADLFAAIGTTWGAGDGSSTFNLPDFARRVAVGSGGVGSVTLGNALGDTGGEESHTQTIAELAAHTHGYTEVVGAGITVTSGAGYNVQGGTTGSTGSSTPFNVMQPSAVVNKIIKT